MARASNLDPLDKFRWLVAIDDFTRAGFVSSSTPEYEINTKKYPEGGNHLNPLQIVDEVSYKPVTLTRGVTTDTSFNKWATGFIDLVQSNSGVTTANPFDTISNFIPGTGSDKFASLVPSNNGNLTNFNYRKTVKIQHLNREGIVQIVYTLYNAFPISYKPASDFEAKADDTVSMETLVIAYEGFDVKYAGIAGAIGNLAANALSSL